MFIEYLEQTLTGQGSFSRGYLGGTLSLAGAGGIYSATFLVSGEGTVVETEGDSSRLFKLSREELFLVAQIYLKNKTKSHAYFKEAQRIVAAERQLIYVNK